MRAELCVSKTPLCEYFSTPSILVCVGGGWSLTSVLNQFVDKTTMVRDHPLMHPTIKRVKSGGIGVMFNDMHIGTPSSNFSELMDDAIQATAEKLGDLARKVTLVVINGDTFDGWTGAYRQSHIMGQTRKFFNDLHHTFPDAISVLIPGNHDYKLVQIGWEPIERIRYGLSRHGILHGAGDQYDDDTGLTLSEHDYAGKSDYPRRLRAAEHWMGLGDLSDKNLFQVWYDRYVIEWMDGTRVCFAHGNKWDWFQCWSNYYADPMLTPKKYIAGILGRNFKPSNRTIGNILYYGLKNWPDEIDGIEKIRYAHEKFHNFCNRKAKTLPAGEWAQVKQWYSALPHHFDREYLEGLVDPYRFMYLLKHMEHTTIEDLKPFVKTPLSLEEYFSTTYDLFLCDDKAEQKQLVNSCRKAIAKDLKANIFAPETAEYISRLPEEQLIKYVYMKEQLGITQKTAHKFTRQHIYKFLGSPEAQGYNAGAVFRPTQILGKVFSGVTFYTRGLTGLVGSKGRNLMPRQLSESKIFQKKMPGDRSLLMKFLHKHPDTHPHKLSGMLCGHSHETSIIPGKLSIACCGSWFTESVSSSKKRPNQKLSNITFIKGGEKNGNLIDVNRLMMPGDHLNKKAVVDAPLLYSMGSVEMGTKKTTGPEPVRNLLVSSKPSKLGLFGRSTRKRAPALG